MNGWFMPWWFGKKSDEEEPTNFGNARVFKHQELEKATKSFSTVIGIGGFGSVYLGTLKDGQKVAVKRLHNNNRRRFKEFITELMVLSALRHKNLVTLYGCTDPRGNELLLVYEYVPNGTVEDHLHGQRSDLTIAVRVQIAVQTAEALVYLHALVQPLIHRDVKTSNIMVDDGFHVKVGDLGMSRLLPWDTTQVTTVPQGTLGYRDPEYDDTCVLTEKSDVYSFGVVVVELISGKKAIDVSRVPCTIYLAVLALDQIKNNKLDEFVDPKLGYNSNTSVNRAINSLAQLARKCLRSRGIKRPTMKQVLTQLKQIAEELQQSSVMIASSVSAFTYEELEMATDGFSEASLLGQAGFGYVHRGKVLPNGKEVVVKQLKAWSEQAEREFQVVAVISRVHHRHLVTLVVYCISGGRMMLVYKFAPKNTLEFHLHTRGRPTMEWPTRLKIALGLAKGLAYLHEDCNPKIIHHDIKTANILLDFMFEAKVADFGKARFVSDNDNHVSTRVMGTFGCKAPEYASTGKLTDKCDVFSFGVVLLELITGRQSVDWTRSFMDDSLVDRARPLLARAIEENNIETFVDKKMRRNYDLTQMSRMISCAAACVRHSAKLRPRMKEIVRVLKGDLSGAMI